MHELPPHLQAGPATPPAPVVKEPSSKGERPFYRKKRYLLPAAVLLLGMCGQNEDTVVADRLPAAQAVVPSPSSTFDAARWLAANDAATTSNARAVASTEAAQKAAAEAAAKAKAKAEAEAAARAEAARVAAERAAAAEAARVAAERAAAAEAARSAAEQAAVQEAARLAAERQAAAVQQPTDVYYANCDAVRAAGAAPIRVGDPGYNRKLDRDGDGQGCGAD